ncbi:hypothetical protein CC614_09365 [Salmonella enterica subsp. enterica serovar Newport]|nr:hypothetical protein [Salmonella enterica subsp. enterica serovar Newport]
MMGHMLLRGLTGMVLAWTVIGFCGMMFFMVDEPVARINVGLWFVFLMIAVFVIVTLLRNVGKRK